MGIVSIISDDKVIGWQHDWWLANLYILPDYRERGVGGALIDRAIQVAQGSDARDLHLVTDTEENWYRKQGWKRVGVGEVHGQEMVVLRRDLAQCQVKTGDTNYPMASLRQFRGVLEMTCQIPAKCHGLRSAPLRGGPDRQ